METKMFAIHNATEAAKISLTQDKVEELRSKVDLEKVCMIIVDEVSTIDTKHIAFLDFRLQQLISNSHPFGGMPMMLAGDFNQLGPVLKDFIPTSMMLFAKRHKKTSHSGKRKHKTTAMQSMVKTREMSTTSTYTDATQAAF
jgi:hypothetical protein